MASIEIPVRDSSEVVEVFLDELPDDPAELMAILRDERAPLHLYLQFACAYYTVKGDKNALKDVLKEGLDEYRHRRTIIESDHDAFVSLSCCLAAHYVLQGLASSPDRTAASFEEANIRLTDAEKRDQRSELLWLRRGMLLLAKASYPAAEYQFNIVLQKDPQWIPARLGLACVAFFSGKYKEALGGFQSIFKALPSGPAELRLAIGLCMARLGFVEAARGAFERIIKVSAGGEGVRADALIALALLNVNAGVRDRAVFQQGMHQLKEAYEADRNQPVPLLHLGNHFFFKQDYTKADALLRKALAMAGPDPGFKAEAHFMLGKLAHAQGRMDEAWRSYAEAVSLNSGLLMAQYGLAQCLVQREDFPGAVACLEKVLAGVPGCIDASRLLGLLLVRLDKDLPRAESLLRDVLARDAEAPSASRAELWLALAKILPPAGALEAYRQAMDVLPERFASSAALKNNLGVLSRDDAMISEGLGHCRTGGDLYDTLLFSKARLLEPSSESRRLYKELLSRRPRLVEAHLRLSALASTPAEATEHAKEALGVSGEASAEAWSMLAATHLRQKAVVPARKAMERLLQRIDRHDIWALTALGNVNADTAKDEEGLRRALEFYQKALSLEPRSALAAQGVAIVLARLGRWAAARDVLLQVRLADPENADAAANLGHCFVELGQYGSAVSAYESALPAAHGKQRVTLLLYASRALYLAARGERNQAASSKAVEMLREAAERLPKDAPLKYNLALCLQELASLLNRALGQLNPAEDEDGSKASSLFAQAQEALNEAQGIFKQVQDDPSIDAKALQQRLAWCETLASALQDRSTASLTRDSSRAQHLHNLQALRAREDQRLADEEAQRKAAWETEQAAIEATRKSMNERLKVVEQMVAAAASTTTPRTSSTQRRSREDAKEELDEEEEEEEVIPKRRRAGRPARAAAGRPSALSKDFISTDDEDEATDAGMLSDHGDKLSDNDGDSQ